VSSGHAPQALVGAATRAVKIGSPMASSGPPCRTRSSTSRRIPASRSRRRSGRGVHAPAVVDGDHQLPEYLGALAKIFKQAGSPGRWPPRPSRPHAVTRSALRTSSGAGGPRGGRGGAAGRQVRHRPECGHAFTRSAGTARAHRSALQVPGPAHHRAARAAARPGSLKVDSK